MCNEQRAVLYARYSPRPKTKHGKVLDCESIEKQFARLEAWAASLGIEIVDRKQDEEASGKEADTRLGLQRALELACKEKCILAVYSLSRLARNTRDAIDISERLQREGADLVSLQERIDTTTPIGRFYFTIIAAMAQLQREQISEVTSSAMKAHQANGRRVTRPDRVPFGSKPSDVDPTKTVPDPHELDTIDLIRKFSEKGKGPTEICRLLDSLGRDRRGKTWAGAHTLVSRLLKRD